MKSTATHHRDQSKLAAEAAVSPATGAPVAASAGRTACELVVLGALTLAALTPFLNKALHIDDPLFVWAAKHIAEHPTDFYGFDVQWSLTVTPMYQETKNPPLACYYLAAAGSLLGWSETALHAAMMLPAVLAVWGAYAVARQCEAPPFWTALATLATPVFLVSASTLMCDVLMLALWLWAAALWMGAVERGSQAVSQSGSQPGSLWRYAAAAVLMGLAALTKYYAAVLMPLLTFYLWRKRGLRTHAVAWMLVPLAMLAAYEVVTHRLYGIGMVSDAMSYAVQFGSWRGEGDATAAAPEDQSALVERAWVGLLFAGGGCLPLLGYLVQRWRAREWTCVAVFLALAVIVLWGADEVARYPLRQAGQIDVSMLVHQALFGLAGTAMAANAIGSAWRRRDTVTQTLALWVLGTLVFAGVVNWTCNGRSILPLAPAAAILALRELNGIATPWPRRWKGLALPAALGLMLSMLVTAADTQFANADRSMAGELLRDYPQSASQAVWFQGHWGWQYYLEQGAARPLDFRETLLRHSDAVLQPGDNTNVIPLGDQVIQSVETRRSQPFRFAATMSQARGAAFYASKLGPLPYRLGPAPPQSYLVLRTHKDLTIKAE